MLSSRIHTGYVILNLFVHVLSQSTTIRLDRYKISPRILRNFIDNMEVQLGLLKYDCQTHRARRLRHEKFPILQISQEISHILMPNVPSEKWKDSIIGLGSEMTMKDHEKMLLPYKTLLDGLPYVKFNLLDFAAGTKLTSDVHYFIFENGAGPINMTSGIPKQIERRFYLKMKRTKFNFFTERFLLIYGAIDEDYHFLLYVVDLEKGKLISLDSLTPNAVTDSDSSDDSSESAVNSIINLKEATFLLRTISTTAKKLDQTQRFQCLHDKDYEWSLAIPRVALQKDDYSCGFYALINMKYFGHQIIPVYRNREVYQLKLVIAYEILRKKLFEMFLDN
ncbi:hypothetical protein SNEBB_007948 [Seison nebaliae]|nr:hypothetical protein SNEBB_007948 [Seison nebaliae]